MKIEVSPAAAAPVLAEFLQRCDCIVAMRDGMVEASPPDRSQTPRAARIELEAYLRVWTALNPGVEITFDRDDVA